MNDKMIAKGTATSPQEFRALTTKIATTLLSDWVGVERSGEAIGRISAALSSAAASSKKPEDFYTCTPASVANCVAIAALTGIMPSTGQASLAYLIPRSPRRGEQKQLGFSFSHRGLNALAARSGQTMIAVPISHDDRISVTPDGEVLVHSIDFDNPPDVYDELRGVIVVVKRIDSGTVITRGWMPKKLIDKRRNESDSYVYATKPGNEWAKDSDPWHKWPIEMAMKAAMHYAVNRGWCVIDDTSSVRALAADASTITVEAIPETERIEGNTLESVAERIAPAEEPVADDKPEQSTDSEEFALQQLIDETIDSIRNCSDPELIERIAKTAKAAVKERGGVVKPIEEARKSQLAALKSKSQQELV